MTNTELQQEFALDLSEEVLAYAIAKKPWLFGLVRSDGAICVIVLYLASEQYMKISIAFNHDLLLEILDYFQQTEQYERCAKITEQIAEFNRLFPCFNLASK